ncbi:hypothetical protein K2173_009713 [Erythroxylum novogranatense]|uniref:Mitochondrial glycoprotein n=1 Tax=Erythroxylum novogranatense TaxID=1862640 RepID=A0AAV8U4P5_9ROSI|nr:hypothetical protein K2173_009713 [Erythroxylum novogranatense]
MALNTILRRSVSTFGPLANQLIQGGCRNYVPAIFAALNYSGLSYKPGYVAPVIRYYSTATETKKPSSTETLLQVIESEIKVAQESDDHDKVEEIPTSFPFKVEDHAGQQTVTLTREYDGESIKVEVHMPDIVSGEDNDIRYDEDDIEKPTQSHLPLLVTVSKKSGISLEFGCIAYADEIVIDSLSVKKTETSEEDIPYEGPNWNDLDENLRKGFHKYLEIRGIKPSTTNFLHEYMINKDSREYVGWLKDLKKFIEE